MYPNYSTHFVCYVLYAIGASSIPTAEQYRVIERAKELLNEVLPSWVDFSMVYSSGGFILDHDLLDLGCF